MGIFGLSWPARDERETVSIPKEREICIAAASVPAPLLQTACGCLIILLAIVVQLEIFGFLSRRQWLPSVFSRKLTHIGAGSAMTTALVFFPRQYWPARLAVSLSLVAFMLLFALVAHMPDNRARGLPPMVQSRLDSLVRPDAHTPLLDMPNIARRPVQTAHSN